LTARAGYAAAYGSATVLVAEQGQGCGGDAADASGIEADVAESLECGLDQ
jgi:hypothetical protein